MLNIVLRSCLFYASIYLHLQIFIHTIWIFLLKWNLAPWSFLQLVLNFQLMLKRIELETGRARHAHVWLCLHSPFLSENKWIQESKVHNETFSVIWKLCGSEINKCLGCLWIYFICGEVCASIFMRKKLKQYTAVLFLRISLSWDHYKRHLQK